MRVNNRRGSIQLPYTSSKISLDSMVCLLQHPLRRCLIHLLTSDMHTHFVLYFCLKVMIFGCLYFKDNISWAGILNRLIFDKLYYSWILS